MTNTKDASRQHLSRIGFLMDQPSQLARQEFAQYLGPQRFAEYQQIVADQQGEDQQNRMYDFMQDMREANLLRCMSPDVTLDTSYYLYEKVLPHLTRGKRVIELACWTGGLSSFIAENHPDCTVVAVDRAQRIVELDRLHFRLPNLDFMVWDYRHGKPNDLEPADLLLCGLGMGFEASLRSLGGRTPVTVQEGFDRTLQLLRDGLAEARRLMNGLRPEVLDDYGLIAAVDRLVRERRERTQASIEWSHRGNFDGLAPPLETTLFRIVQEGLANAPRHSGSRKVRIALVQNGRRIRAVITDWGCGFDPQKVARNRFGVRGICERAKVFGGRATIESVPGRGTRVVIEMPFVES